MTARRVRIAVGASSVALATIALSLAACATAPTAGRTYSASDLRTAPLPSFLPTPPASGLVLTGTAAAPALTVQGAAVDLHLTDGRTVRGVVIGPQVPGTGLPVVQPTTTATFTVRFSDASAPIDLDPTQFRARDHLGHVYPLSAVPDAAPIPATIEPGQTVEFEVRAVVVTGEGIVQWAPDRQSPLGSWDYIAEND